MLAPFVSASVMDWIPVAVLGASLLGSAHCVAMCGGLVLAVTRDLVSVVLYHIGRLLGYVALGAIAGFLGQTVLQTQTLGWISWFASVLMGMGFILLGARLWKSQPLHLFSLPAGFLKRVQRWGPSTIGFFSALLPCGWLHVFVLGAIATRSAWLGALYLFFFWLGTVPALILGPWALSRFFQPWMQKAPRVSALILILIGVSALGFKMKPQPAGSCCHAQPQVRSHD